MLAPYFTLYTKNRPKQTKNTNVTAKTIKFLQENKGGGLHVIEFVNHFFPMLPKAWSTKEKNK